MRPVEFGVEGARAGSKWSGGGAAPARPSTQHSSSIQRFAFAVEGLARAAMPPGANDFMPIFRALTGANQTDRRESMASKAKNRPGCDRRHALARRCVTTVNAPGRGPA